jgi:galactose mutarotase-like enzyme
MRQEREQSGLGVSITEGSYKDVRALVLESAALRITVVPDWGAKMASLVHKKTGFEHLYQLPGQAFRKVAYGASYAEGEVAGFDEMFPSISECYCDLAPWAGVKIPDHGEVWSIPWQFEVSESEVRLTVHGVRFPYALAKKVTLERANTILLRYEAENLSPCDFPCMWAAHPLFNMTPATRIILPESARNIINTVPGPALGDYGGRFSFPLARTAAGQQWDLSRVNPNEGKFYFKYFFLDDLEEGFAIVHDPKTRETVGMTWPVDQVPYLGMWVNEGAWEGQYNVAPEPCTAPFDRWDTARQWGKLPVIPAFGKRQWSLRITVGLADNPRRVEPDGTIR